MTYKDITINEPSLEMFEEFIRETKLPIVAEEVYTHYKKRNWLTKKGTKAHSVEVLCTVWNGNPSHRIGVACGNDKVKRETIDLEYRRYEIAKYIYPTMLQVYLSKCDIIQRKLIDENAIAKKAVLFADALIEELKK